MSDPPHQPPPRIIGRYALFADIASGGMATVHIGRLLGPVGFSRTVAIKRLHGQFAQDPEFVTMFLDEARLAARIRHPNVVPTLDVVATHGELFLVMEYVQGESLAELLRISIKAGCLIPHDIVRATMTGILHGLHAAHEAKSERGEPLGIVHRDVSPQNVLVGTDGIARVLDFGIAKAAGGAHVTRDHHVKGKLSYMAPEQFQTSTVDRRVDVYSAAVVLWEVLTGTRLFLQETESATLAHVLTGHVPPPSTIVAGIPHALDDLVLRGLNRNPERRFVTAREMALALEASGPLSTPSVVGEWVERTAHRGLSVRAAHIAKVERTKDLPSLAVSSHPPPFAVGSVSSDSPTQALRLPMLRLSAPVAIATATAVTRELWRGAGSLTTWLLPTERRRRRVAVAIGTGALLASLPIWLSVHQHTAEDMPLRDAAQPSATGSFLRPLAEAPGAHFEHSSLGAQASTESSALPPVALDARVDPAPVRSTEQAASASATPIQDKTNASRGVGSRPAAAILPKKASGSDCNPPYTIDTAGHRHYKMECL